MKLAKNGERRLLDEENRLIIMGQIGEKRTN